MVDYDVIVVGGGPGGSTCSTFLGKMGHKVLLLDKARFPRDKVCGDGITGKSKGIIRELGLLETVENSPHAVYDGIGVFVDNHSVVAKSEDGRFSYVCRREVYDNILFQNAKKHATVREDFAVTDVILENGKVVGVKGIDGESKKEEEIRSKVVVGADGANSVVATKLGLNTFEPKHRASAIRAYYKNVSAGKDLEIYFPEKIIPGYLWIFPLEDNTVNIGVGMLVDSMKKRNINLQQLMEDEIKNNPALKDRFKGAEMVGGVRGWNLPMASHKRKIYGDGFILIGDAASLIDPFSGEGIGNAMLSAKIGSGVIDEAIKKNDFSSSVLKKYSDALWDDIGSEISSSNFVQKLLSFKILVKLFMTKLAKSKQFRGQIAQLFLDHAKMSKTNQLFGIIKLLLL